MCFGAIGSLFASCFGMIAMKLGCAACSAVGSMVSTATRISYALLLLVATLTALGAIN
jgi:hypothetical protein